MLELFCQYPEDEAKFFRYLKKNPDVIWLRFYQILVIALYIGASPSW